MKLYPLKFSPVYKYRIWGGEKLKTHLNKQYKQEHIGESWEISDVSGSETRVSNGELKGESIKDLIKKYKGDFLGNKNFEVFGANFPLLIKFIDAKTPLSVQVHPNDEVAKIRHNSFGKNEMWYVLQADENAELILGFEKELDKNSFKEHLKNNTILNVLHHEQVEEGDTYFIPTGQVHAIGAGVLLAEIQQTSDITYRIYDYDRIDAISGEKRELHTDFATEVMDFKVNSENKIRYNLESNKLNKLVSARNFKTHIINVNGKLDLNYNSLDSFVILICVEGALELVHNNSNYFVEKGETLLLPACINSISIKSDASKLIEVSV